MTALARTARSAFALLVGLVALAPAASARAPQPSTTTKLTSKPTVGTVTDAARLDTCFKLDTRTGQLVPCTNTSSGGVSGGSSATTPPPPPPPAFDYFDADHDQGDFDADAESVLPNAYLLSQLSAASYLAPGYGEGQAYRVAEELGLESLTVIEAEYHSVLDLGGPGGASKVYVFYNDEAVFLAFEGTTGILEWEETNLDFVPYAKPEWGTVDQTVCYGFGCFSVTLDQVTIHNGFYDAMDLVYDQVRAAIAPLVGTRELWITGHSLGGAVAILTAFRLHFDHGFDVQGVHTFGAPAVGDGLWAQVFDAEMSNVHRWSLEHDPAPAVAHWPMFTHVGIANNLYGNGDLVLDDMDLWYYVPECALGYSVVVVHMSYWPRMHEELSETHPELIPLLPASLPGMTDGDDTCYF